LEKNAGCGLMQINKESILGFLADTGSAFIANVLTLGAVGAVTYWVILPQINKQPLPSWEYKIVAPDDLTIKEQLNIYGIEGWEIVSARRATNSETSTASYEIILKRKSR
jgi:hypothetical protein